MEKYRIGNDVRVRWAIFDGENPVDFTGKKITIEIRYTNSRRLRYEQEYTVNGNVIEVQFTAKEQEKVGVYDLWLEYTYPDIDVEGGIATVTLDNCRAFELVAKSCQLALSGKDILYLEGFVSYGFTQKDKEELARLILDDPGVSDVIEQTILDNNLQKKLVSGENIKTVNGKSLLGEGDITIEGGSLSEEDPTVPEHVKNISQDDINKWDSESGEGVKYTEEKGFFIVDADGKIGAKYDEKGLDVAKVSDHFKMLVGGGGENSFEFDHLVFTDIYMVDNKYKENQFIPVIQSERFVNDILSNNVKEHTLHPLVNGAYSCVPALGKLSSSDALMTGGTTKSIGLDLELSCKNNLIKYTIPYTLKKTYSESVNSQIRLLCISDSFGASQGGSDLYPEYSFFSYAQKLGMADAALRGLENRYITLGMTGIRFNGWGSWKAGGQNLTLISHSEGRGFWKASTYARHLFYTANSKGLWYILGLDAEYGEYEDYQGVVSRGKLINSSPSKLIDISYIKNEDAFKVAFKDSPVVPWDNGSTEAKLAAVDYYNSMITNTLTVTNHITGGYNPFFNINKPGQIKFDLQTYLDNWKTHEDDGVTPLIVGETAGNKVIDINNNIKICTPTHVCILIGTNDTATVSDSENLYNDMIGMAESCLINSEIKVCLVFPITAGTAYPERYPNITVQEPWWPHVEAKWNCFKELQELFKNDTSIDKSRICFLDTFICTDTSSSSPGSVPALTANGLSPAHIIKKDPVHLGISSHRDIGYQIYAWSYYSLFN